MCSELLLLVLHHSELMERVASNSISFFILLFPTHHLALFLLLSSLVCRSNAADSLLPMALASSASFNVGLVNDDSANPGASRTIEMSNSSGGIVDCDWTMSAGGTSYVSSMMASSSLPSPSPTSASAIILTWLDANRQPVVSIPGLR